MGLFTEQLFALFENLIALTAQQNVMLSITTVENQIPVPSSQMHTAVKHNNLYQQHFTTRVAKNELYRRRGRGEGIMITKERFSRRGEPGGLRRV